MKAQFWSFDIIFAMVIFMFTLVILSFVWYNIGNQLTTASSLGGALAQLQLQTLSNILMSPGTPTDWESWVNATNTLTWNNVSIGLGTGMGNSISPSKVATLMAMSNYNYQDSKSVLGVSYNYYITISSQNMHITLGRNPQYGNPTSVQVESQSVFINGEPANMQVLLWTNTTFGIG